ncbi:2-phosphosulfolactate phosphatase [Paenibacillus koleovorans]|uniref:2-phosphosulfolactate phosphatase n=1 Tax=Paenibacillus koleovorans TaxID=121608 RepID=UPI000FDA0158|nr:2-phosphosulfolactate phosphatase [Paenibacillus koleovorans]
MQIHVIPSVIEARSDDFVYKTVIVIDVLRATSTIVTALAHGASGIVPVETVQQAKQQQEPDDWLGGERFCKKIAGFHLGNSPLEFQGPDVAGRRIILTTTNGTRAIQKSLRAESVLAGSLLNVEAAARRAAELRREIAIVCSGTQDEFCLEDGLCAGALVEELVRKTGAEQLEVNDFGLAMRQAYLSCHDDLPTALLASASGRKLCKLGNRDDVLYCAQLNRHPIVPQLHGTVMTATTGSHGSSISVLSS